MKKMISSSSAFDAAGKACNNERISTRFLRLPQAISQDERMQEHLLSFEQTGENSVERAKVADPDRGIDEDHRVGLRRDRLGFRLAAPEHGEPAGAVRAISVQNPRPDQCRLLPHSREFRRLLEHLVVDVECGPHTYIDAIFVCISRDCAAIDTRNSRAYAGGHLSRTLPAESLFTDRRPAVRRITLSLPAMLTMMLLSQNGTVLGEETVGQRPYEMVWANRTRTRVRRWWISRTSTAGPSRASMPWPPSRSREQQLWGDYVGKLVYRGTGQGRRS